MGVFILYAGVAVASVGLYNSDWSTMFWGIVLFLLGAVISERMSHHGL